MDVSPDEGGTVHIDEFVPSSYPSTYTFDDGTSINLEAVPASGYVFTNWSGDLSGDTNLKTVVLSSNKSIIANFSPAVYTLIVQSNGSGSTSPTVGTHDYDGGTEVSITATPDSGWQFDSWTGDVSSPSSAATTVTMDSDKSITANFSQLAAHTLAIHLNGSGSTSPTVGTHDYDGGTEVSITATPGNGWQFDSWTGDVANPSSAAITVTMDSDKSVTANFSRLTHTLTIELSGSGSTSPTVGTHDYDGGTEVSITETPGSGWQFDSWTGDVSNPGSATTIVTMDSDKIITANFSEITTIPITGIQLSWPLVGGGIAGLVLVGWIVTVQIRRRRDYF